MKKFIIAICAILFATTGLKAFAATPQEALTFFNNYISAANNYSDSIPTFYAPDAKIIRQGTNSAGKKVSVVVDTKQYFNQLRLGANLAKLKNYKNKRVPQ